MIFKWQWDLSRTYSQQVGMRFAEVEAHDTGRSLVHTLRVLHNNNNNINQTPSRHIVTDCFLAPYKYSYLLTY